MPFAERARFLERLSDTLPHADALPAAKPLLERQGQRAVN